jgi:alkylation response protein AidB-like acyl-CoA dehydrogenase
MNFGLTEEQQLLKNSARQFFSAECPVAEVRRLMETETAHDAALWQKMAEQGWTGLPFPEQYGGMGLGLVDLAAACEEMGQALVPGAFLATVPLAGMAVYAAGNDQQKQKYLAPICGGEARASLALLEKDASWDPSAVKATLAGGVLSGQKLFVPDADVASFLVCVVRQGGELALVVVDRHAPGVTLEAQPAMDTTRKLYAVSFAGVAIKPEDVLATGDAARVALDRALNVATVALAAEMTGGMQRMLDLTVAYAKTRKQFGKTIGQFQAVQHMCADMLILLEGARSATYYAAWALQENAPDAGVAVSVAKAYASDAYREAGNRAIQVHGGMGFTWENDVHLYYRRAKASEITFGDAAYHRERMAKTLIGSTD